MASLYCEQSVGPVDVFSPLSLLWPFSCAAYTDNSCLTWILQHKVTSSLDTLNSVLLRFLGINNTVCASQMSTLLLRAISICFFITPEDNNRIQSLFWHIERLWYYKGKIVHVLQACTGSKYTNTPCINSVYVIFSCDRSFFTLRSQNRLEPPSVT